MNNSTNRSTSMRGRVVSPWQTELYRRLAEPLTMLLGESTAKRLAKMGLVTVQDLLHHFPRRYLTGTKDANLGNIAPGEDVAVVAKVAGTRVGAPGPRNQRLQVLLTDGRGYLSAVFFGKEYLIEFWRKQLSQGQYGIFIGKVSVYRDQLQMAHPTFVMLDEDGAIVGSADHDRAAMAKRVTRGKLVPLYPSSAKMPTWQIAECIDIVLDSLAGVHDDLPADQAEKLGLVNYLRALYRVHRPTELRQVSEGKRRLAFEEALILQLGVVKRRNALLAESAGPIVPGPGGLLAKFDQQLVFQLTDGQLAVSEQIFTDLAGQHPMCRLLQGEVGAGKTVVALRAMLAAIEAGYQAALLAPTEVLAAQHAQSITDLLGDLANTGLLGSQGEGVRVELLTGSMKTAQRRDALNAIINGDANLVIGTHALLSEKVEFFNLGLVVLDEQHRFGVEQRAALAGKADKAPHQLILTATPIPRSVAMTFYGELAVSNLRALPKGRKEVQTTKVPMEIWPHFVDRAWERMREEVAAGRQAFIVCPKISEDEDAELGRFSVEGLARELAAGPLQGLRLAVLHGRLAAEEKAAVMAKVVAGEVDVLIATTVIEVGVDVPNASMMVVMDADRFGISQLHQLRGRIGRGEHPGLCLLMTNCEPGSVADQRLDALVNSRDGFELAEIDLELRHEGDILGTKQSGRQSSLKVLKITSDAELIKQARSYAEQLLAQDPTEQSPWLADMAHYLATNASVDWLEGA